MKRSAFIAMTVLCTLPLLFSFNTISNNVLDGTGKLIVKVTPIDNQQAIICRLYNMQEKPTRIIIKDTEDNILLSKKIMSHNGFRKKINLRNLAYGKYNLMVLHPNESKYATLLVKNRSVEIDWRK
ncbi:MAG: hypothetical protein AAFZ15_28940 [Bacteroidota bacterium]